MIPASLHAWITVVVAVAAGQATDPLFGEEKKIRIDGNIILGGMFPMHEAGTTNDPCGAIKEEKGVQRLEAMLYALDEINRDPQLLPNISLGALILDTCSRDTYALEQAMQFVKASLSEDVSEFRCEDGKPPRQPDRKPVAGVIGAASSTVSVMVANILRLFRIPQISYASTSTELSDKARFGFFSRVVPPDNFQAQAMVEVVKQFGWSYVSTVAVEGDYGEKGIASFSELADKAGLCIAVNEKIARNAINEDFDRIVESLSQKPGARAVVMFVDEDNCRKLLSAAKKAGRNFLWMGSDSWGAKIHPVKEQETVAEGAITVLPKKTSLSGFDEYFRNLRPSNNRRNVWFKEFWEQQFNCTFKPNHSQPKCRDDMALHRYEQEGLVPFVVDAVYAMAHALHKLIIDKCGTEPMEICFKVDEIDGRELLRYIRNVSFIGMQNHEVRFNKDGDAYGSYNIYQYQRKDDKYDYVAIGEWVERLTLNVSQTRWKNGNNTIPSSVCSWPCPVGHIRNYQGSRCCWVCVPCREDEYIFNDTCLPCENGYGPNANKSACFKLQVEYITWGSPWALVPIVFSAIGIICTLFILAVFVRFNSTPVVMASGRELCYVLLLGILLCYSTSFVVLAKPSTATCTLLRVKLGLCLCICYSAIFTKTNRISRIFNRGIKSIKRPSYTSPRSQIVICLGLVSVQLVGTIAWLIMEEPRTREFYPTRSMAVLQCGISNVSLIMSLAYNMLLIALCTIYAFKTRKIPENFNEAKYIGFTMYSTCIVWLAFVPIYFGTNNDYKIQVASICMCISISASVALGCLFTPKIYIVLCQPYKNVRQVSSQSSGAGARSRFALAKPSTSHRSSPRPTTVNGDLATSPSAEESSMS